MTDQAKKNSQKQNTQKKANNGEDDGVSLISNQLNWYDLETKCQKLCYDIMQPQIQRQLQDRDHLDHIDTILKDDIKKRIEDIEYFILKKKKNQKDNPTLIDLCNIRLDKFEADSKESFNKFIERFEQIEGQQKIFQNRITKNEDHCQVVNERMTLIDNDMKNFAKIINDNKRQAFEFIEQTLNEQGLKILKSIEATRILTEKANSIASTLAEHSTSISIATENINILQKESQAMYRDICNLENIKMDRAVIKEEFAEVNHNQAKLFTMISMKENHMITIENFIEKFLPVRVLTQVSEVINIIHPNIESAAIQRLQKYERAQYRKFSYGILKDSGIPDLMKIITEVTNRLNNILKQPTDPAQTVKKVKSSLSQQNSIQEAESDQSDQDPKKQPKKEELNEEQLNFRKKIDLMHNKNEVNYSMSIPRPSLQDNRMNVIDPIKEETEQMKQDIRTREEAASAGRLQKNRLQQLKVANQITGKNIESFATLDAVSQPILRAPKHHQSEANIAPTKIGMARKLLNDKTHGNFSHQNGAFRNNQLGGEDLDELSNRIYQQREELLEFIRQDRIQSQNLISQLVKQLEEKLLVEVDQVRQDQFEIFKEIGSVREKDRIVSLDQELAQLKSQMKDMHTRNTLESIQSTNLLSSRTPRKVGTAEFGSRSRRQINFGSNENHFNFKQLQQPKKHVVSDVKITSQLTCSPYSSLFIGNSFQLM